MMDTETCRKFRWFWAWQDEREEAWLGEMSREGWHLSETGFPGVYIFHKGDPKNYIYRLDFQTSNIKDREVYLQLFRDAGWEHVGNMSAWEYFRKEAKPGEKPEIFTDPESKIKKYQRLLFWLALFLPIFIITAITLSRHLEATGVFGIGLFCLMMGILSLFFIGILQISRRIGELRKSLHA